MIEAPQFNGNQTANFLSVVQWFDKRLRESEDKIVGKLDEHARAEATLHVSFQAHLDDERRAAERLAKVQGAGAFIARNWKVLAMVAAVFLGAVGVDDLLRLF